MMVIDNDHSSSIFTAEANAIDMALGAINKTNNINCLILSDSLSCLMALKSSDTKNPIILKLKLRMHRIISRGINISLIWIPSHVGIEGNEMADELAKFSLKNEDIKNLKVPCSDYKLLISEHFQNKWQASWNKEASNKLHAIQRKLRRRKHC